MSDVVASTAVPRLAAAIDALLPQTQCRKCGYAGCGPYAEAIAAGHAAINRCPPGGVAGIAALAALTGRPLLALDPACGSEGPRRPRSMSERLTETAGRTLSVSPFRSTARSSMRGPGGIRWVCSWKRKSPRIRST